MAFPTDLTNAVDDTTDVLAAHLNNLEAKVGIDDSAVATSLDYLVKNPLSVDPGHTHTETDPIVGAINGLVKANGAGTIAAAEAADIPDLSGTYSVTGHDHSGVYEPADADIQATITDVADLVTLSGVAANSANLGEFSGSTITDNQTVKAALQLLETAVEGATGDVTAATFMDPTPDTDLTYSGFPLTGTAGETLALGDAVYKKAADSKLWKALGDAVGTMPAVGVIVVGGNADEAVTYIDDGYLRKDAWTWTVAGKIYVSPATAGLVTQTAPSTEGDQLQELGYAESADVLRVKVNHLLVEIGDGLTDLASEVTGVLPPDNGGTGVANNAASTLTISGNYATTLTVTGTTGVTLPTTGTLATRAGTETLTNKRVTPRVTSVASSATPTPNCDNEDMYSLTALAAAAEFQTPGGTPTNGQRLLLRVQDDGTARALTFVAAYRGSDDLTLPTTTVQGKSSYFNFIYDSVDAKWDYTGKIGGF